MRNTDKCLERVLFDFCGVLAERHEDETEDKNTGYDKVAQAIRRVQSDCFATFGCSVVTLQFGEETYELVTYDGEEESMVYATEEEAEAHAPKDGSPYDIYHKGPQELYCVVDSEGKVLMDGAIYEEQRSAFIAILREFEPSWKKALEHCKEVAQAKAFSEEWEEELRETIKTEEALSEGVTLSDDTLASNYIYHLVLANQ